MIKKLIFMTIIVVVFVLSNNFANAQTEEATNSTATETAENKTATSVEVPPVANARIGTTKLSPDSKLTPPKVSVSNLVGEKSGTDAALKLDTFPGISVTGFDDFGTDFLTSFPNSGIDFNKLENIAATKAEILPGVSLSGFGSFGTPFLPNFLNNAIVNPVDVKKSTSNATQKAEVSPAISLPKFGDLEQGLVFSSLSEAIANITDDKKTENKTTTKVDELPAVSLPNFGNFGSGFDLGINNFAVPESYTPYIASDLAFPTYDGGLRPPILSLLNPLLANEYSAPEIYLKK